jgi:hypothetical protein
VRAGDAAPAAKRSRADGDSAAGTGLAAGTPAAAPPRPSIASTAVSVPSDLAVAPELKGTSMDLSQPLYGAKMAPVRVSAPAGAELGGGGWDGAW